ncbi:MAG: response regulator transcription factor, partial [Leptolinea sp.]|nr:response regulator transcription factor [Leptolinea sp.]
TADDGLEALRVAHESQPDLILLDVMIPQMDGMDVCREIRKTSEVPVIMITARGEEVDRVVGLELGADDYVCKPFSVRELMARIKAVLRRNNSHVSSKQEPVELKGPGDLVINLGNRQTFLSGSPLALTRLEFDVLALLVKNKGKVLTRDRLLEEAWGYDFAGDTRAVDSTVKRLRAKLRAAADGLDPIEAVRGVGYRVIS